MKKPILQTLFFAFFLITAYAIKEALTISDEIFIEQEVVNKDVKVPWQKIHKSKTGVVAVPATIDDAKKYKLDNKPKPKRKVASIKGPKRFGRKLVGNNAQEFSSAKNNLEMINEINPNWIDRLGTELMRFQDNKTKVFVKKMESVIKIENGKGRYLELVLITYNKTNTKNSFNAYVDSSNGTILSTWNRTIHENFKKKPFVMIPTNQ